MASHRSSRGTRFARVAAAALLIAAAAAARQSAPAGGGTRPAEPVVEPDASPAGLFGPGLLIPDVRVAPDDPVALARAADERAFQQYLHAREVLIARGFLGKWIAIADGMLLPVADGKLAPADSLDALHFLIELDHGTSPHRFVFRVGEEGDVAYHFFAPNLPWSDALGTGLFRAAFSDETDVKIVFAPDRVYATHHGKTHSWPYGEKGIPLELADPSGSIKVPAIVTPSSACDGTLVLSEETAAKLGLTKFEIPGTCWYGPEENGDSRFACRRARLRWRVPELDVDVLVPVAIWPKR